MFLPTINFFALLDVEVEVEEVVTVNGNFMGRELN